MDKILVTGGAGYIGSHVVEELMYAGFCPVVIDYRNDEYSDEMARYVEVLNMSLTSSYNAFVKHKFIGVIHLAGSIQVGESAVKPALYYHNNVGTSMDLLECAKAAGVKAFVFSSTAAVYGNAKSGLIPENAPLNPINTYGRSKLMFEQILKDYDSAYDFRSISLRYFNAAGASASGRFGENHGKPDTHLIPAIIEAAQGQRENFKIFGTDYDTPDGTCIRDYVHVTDLAVAHVNALKFLLDGGPTETMNLGSGRGFSVREIVNAVQRKAGTPFEIIEHPRRPGDPDSLIADISRAKQILQYNPVNSDLENIIETAWNWHSHN